MKKNKLIQIKDTSKSKAAVSMEYKLLDHCVDQCQIHMFDLAMYDFDVEKSLNEIYQLCLEIETPKKVLFKEIFNFIYHIKNYLVLIANEKQEESKVTLNNFYLLLKAFQNEIYHPLLTLDYTGTKQAYKENLRKIKTDALNYYALLYEFLHFLQNQYQLKQSLSKEHFTIELTASINYQYFLLRTYQETLPKDSPDWLAKIIQGLLKEIDPLKSSIPLPKVNSFLTALNAFCAKPGVKATQTHLIKAAENIAPYPQANRIRGLVAGLFTATLIASAIVLFPYSLPVLAGAIAITTLLGAISLTATVYCIKSLFFTPSPLVNQCKQLPTAENHEAKYEIVLH